MAVGQLRRTLALTLGVQAVGCVGSSPSAAQTEATTQLDADESEASSSEASSTEEASSTDESSTPDLPKETCCGCLCVDPSWSCSADTCITEQGEAWDLETEAGFLQIDGGDYLVNGLAAQSGDARIWYSFHPAEDDAANRPLLVFFNGGPGSATAPLLAYNFAPTSFDPNLLNGRPYAPNEHSWTQLANLLFIDAPNTGFSYTLALEGDVQPSVRIDPQRDASTVLRMVLAFLGRHPQIESQRVVLVAESYGGVRATWMLRQFLDYQTLDSGDYQDLALLADIEAHLERAFPDATEPLTPATLSEQFGHQILLQALVAGSTQQDLDIPAQPPGCIEGGDLYQCDEPLGFTFDRIYAAANAMTHLDTLQAAIGVDPLSIEWLYANQRTQAYGRSQVGNSEEAAVDLSEMQAQFGALTDDDRYFVAFNWAVNAQHPQGMSSLNPAVGEAFLKNTLWADTFLTDAAFDLALWGPNIPLALASYADWLIDAQHDTAPQAGVERPGWIDLSYTAEATPEGEAPQRVLRFPHYAGSGHMIGLRQPAELLADVGDWLAL